MAALFRVWVHLAISASLTIGQFTSEDGINLCPEEIPYAYSYGSKCCSYPSQNYFDNYQWNENDCGGESISCPSAVCISYFHGCDLEIRAYNFILQSLNQAYINSEENAITFDHKPVYIGLDNQHCIWWNYESKRWWIGDCIDIGFNNGYAYLDQNETCPENIDNKELQQQKLWKLQTTNQLIDGVTGYPWQTGVWRKNLLCEDLTNVPQSNITEVCPADHPYAFDNGSKCCSKNGGAETNLFWYLENNCQGNAVSCPFTNCDHGINTWGSRASRFICESREITVSGFSDDNYNQVYGNLCGYINNRIVYISTDSKLCIWWHYQTRKWWMGSCQEAGANVGLAYLEQVSCPISSSFSWRNGTTNEELQGLSIFKKFEYIPSELDASDAKIPLKASSTSAVSFARDGEGLNIPRCKWTYIRRFKYFRCIGNNAKRVIFPSN